LWSGTISFGLVSIPVNLYPGNRDSRVPLRLVGPKGTPLGREYVSPDSGASLDTCATERGFETDKGYIVVRDDELERLAPEKSRDIDLRLFAAREEISPLFFVKSYFLTPGDQSAKAYRLLAETMERKERVGVATFVMHGKEYLVAILAEHGILRAQILRFVDEVRMPHDIGLPKKAKTSASRVRKFETAIAKAMKKTVEPKEMRDEYAASMLKLIETKSRRHRGVIEAENKTEQRRPAQVVDLMEVLKRSLKRSRPG
jgi:DNA end-binding protein Ku